MEWKEISQKILIIHYKLELYALLQNFSIEYNYLPLILGIILGSIALVAIILVIRSSRKKRSPKIVQTIPQQIPQQNPQQPLSKSAKSIKYCMKCGHQNREGGMFCEECGTKRPF